MRRRCEQQAQSRHLAIKQEQSTAASHMTGSANPEPMSAWLPNTGRIAAIATSSASSGVSSAAAATFTATPTAT